MTFGLGILTLVLLVGPGVNAHAQSRMPPIPADKMTAEQKKAAEEFKVARGATDLPGPFVALVRSPQLLNLASAIGIWTRKTSLPPRLMEFVVIITSREWTSNFEWRGHSATAIKGGLKQEIVNAVAEGRRPPRMAEDEEIVYDFTLELLKNRSVSDVTYGRALSKFGEQGIIDMVGISGYYSMIAMVLNTARTPLPEGAEPSLAPFPMNR